MNYWDSVGRWINTLLVFIVGVLAFDALFRLLEANEDNVIVAFVRVLSVVFLVPFRGMFGEQDYVLTTLVGVLGYSLLAGIALGVLRSLQASLAQPAPSVRPDARPTSASVVDDRDAQRQLPVGDVDQQAVPQAAARARRDGPADALEAGPVPLAERRDAGGGNGVPTRSAPAVDDARSRSAERRRNRAIIRRGSSAATERETGT